MKKNRAILFASNNTHKLEECKRILPSISFISPAELNITIHPTEDGTSFVDNALIKGSMFYHAYKKIAQEKNIKIAGVLAEDSGLCVHALNNAPGIYSARYKKNKNNSSLDANDPLYQCKCIIKDLNDATTSHIPHDRSAHFVCCVALFISENNFIVSHADWHGSIIQSHPQHLNGFGYDPIFFVPSKNCTSSQLSQEEKNQISHRAKALRKIENNIFDILEK